MPNTSKRIPLDKDFALDVSRRRGALRISQHAVAQRAGVSEVTISRIETMRQGPPPEVRQAVLDALDALEREARAAWGATA